jgi:hypothetical protein
MPVSSVLDLIAVLSEIIAAAVRALRNPGDGDARKILEQVPLSRLKKIAAEARAQAKFTGA